MQVSHLSISYKHAFFDLQAKALYHKIGHQAETIKGMWVTQLNLKGKSELASPTDMREYEELKEEVFKCALRGIYMCLERYLHVYLHVPPWYTR